MASINKHSKHVYVAPGTLGNNRGIGVKKRVAPGFVTSSFPKSSSTNFGGNDGHSTSTTIDAPSLVPPPHVPLSEGDRSVQKQPSHGDASTFASEKSIKAWNGKVRSVNQSLASIASVDAPPTSTPQDTFEKEIEMACREENDELRTSKDVVTKKRSRPLNFKTGATNQSLESIGALPTFSPRDTFGKEPEMACRGENDEQRTSKASDVVTRKRSRPLNSKTRATNQSLECVGAPPTSPPRDTFEKELEMTCREENDEQRTSKDVVTRKRSRPLNSKTRATNQSLESVGAHPPTSTLQSTFEQETEMTFREENDGEQTSNGDDFLNSKRNKAPNAKPRGVNQCRKVAALKPGAKLEVDFFLNGPVGDNQAELTRHMGKIIHDSSICPFRIHSWDEIGENRKEIMWRSVLNKFCGRGMDLNRHATLNHMKRLWQNWRSLLKRDHFNNKRTLGEALSSIPKGVTKEDWEWLVKERFMNPDFKEVSARNSENRSHKKMPHRTGSKPFRQIIYDDMGGKEGKMPSISEIFMKTRKRKCGTLDDMCTEKYEEIVDVENDNPTLSEFEVVEQCFGPQDRDHVVCFGYGMRPKDVRGPLPTRDELTIKLHKKEEENDELRQRMDEMEATYKEKMSSMEEKINILMNRIIQGD